MHFIIIVFHELLTIIVIHELLTIIVFHEILKDIRKMPMRHFTMGVICTTQHKQSILLKNEKQTWKTCIVGIILPRPTKLIHQTQQNFHKPYSTSYFQNLTKRQSKKSRARNRKYIEKMTKPIPFLEDWWRDNEENGGFVRTRWVWKGEEWTRLWTVTMNEGKMKSFWKTALKMTLKVQNTCFLRLEWVASKSPSQAAKNPCYKFWKICLSVFRDWKVHPRVSREPFWVKLVTGASTREQVTKLSRENAKNPDFWNFSKSFSQLEPWHAKESPRASV